MRKQEREAISYIISMKGDMIDRLELAEVCSWIAQKAVFNKSAPTFEYFCEYLVSTLVELIMEEYGPSALLEKLDEKELFYVNEFGRTCSIFKDVSFNGDVNIPQKLLKPMAFKYATFNGEVHIGAIDVPKAIFLNSVFKKDVRLSEGCKSLDTKCFQSDFTSGAKLYIPKTVESINDQSFAEDAYTKNNIYFGGTVEQFNELTIKAGMSSSTVNTNKWPKSVVCSDGIWSN